MMIMMVDDHDDHDDHDDDLDEEEEEEEDGDDDDGHHHHHDIIIMIWMSEGASRAQASRAIPCTSEPKSRAHTRRLPVDFRRNMGNVQESSLPLPVFLAGSKSMLGLYNHLRNWTIPY